MKTERDNKGRKVEEQGAEAEPMVFPMRINKYLALEGRGSRREMDKLVEGGKILINDRPAVLGDKVDEGDRVEIRFHKVKQGGK